MNEMIERYEEKMGKTLDSLERDYVGIRAGRANPRLLDKITVDYYGTPTPLQQVGNISVPDPKSILIAPWEPKMVKEIERAINASDIGINPTNDGKNVRLTFPDLTEERRKELAKDVKKRGEDAKVAIRNIRRDGIEVIKKITKAGEVSEDEGRDLENEMQKITDQYIGEIDKAVETKTQEVMIV